MEVINSKKYIVGKSHELIKYYDLGYLLNNLEDLITLPTPYKDSKISAWQHMTNKEIAMNCIETSEQAYNQLLSEIEIRKTTFDYLRTINPDFCKDIKSHLSIDEYSEYVFLLRNCSKDVTKLISSFQEKNIYNNDYKNLLLSKKDLVSNIIDTEENSRLTYLQDSFVLGELDSLDDLDIDIEMQENISSIRQQLEERIAKYNDFQKLYSSNNKIRVRQKYKKEERE